MPTPFEYADVSVYVQSSGTTRPAVLTFGVDGGSKTASAIHADIAASLAIATGIKTRLSNGCSFNRVRVALGVMDGEDIVHDAPISVAGTLGTAVLPSNCACLVHKRTARGGRRGRGRLFLPWVLPEGLVAENGIITGSEQVLIQTAVSAWHADLSTRGVPMVLLHQAGASSEGPPDAVTSLSVDGMVSTQRRRLGR